VLPTPWPALTLATVGLNFFCHRCVPPKASRDIYSSNIYTADRGTEALLIALSHCPTATARAVISQTCYAPLHRADLVCLCSTRHGWNAQVCAEEGAGFPKISEACAPSFRSARSRLRVTDLGKIESVRLRKTHHLESRGKGANPRRSSCRGFSAPWL